ncbi:MAG: DUF2857 family protein [Betaproteobacteria bacterium]|nr:DUF2857 family protein [Betaproteobacteria bacterium]
MTVPDDAIVMPISGDPPLVGALLLRVIAQGDGGSLAPAPGTSCATLAALRALSPLETWRLSGMRKSGLALVIDTRQLAENLRALRHSNEEAALAAYFVSHGASRGMLHQLFHLSHNAITRQRRRLGVHLGQGRPPLPDPATRDAIHRRWADLGRHESDLRRRLQQLHHQFAAYPLVVLSAVLHEFDTAPATAPPLRESACLTQPNTSPPHGSSPPGEPGHGCS